MTIGLFVGLLHAKNGMETQVFNLGLGLGLGVRVSKHPVFVLTILDWMSCLCEQKLRTGASFFLSLMNRKLLIRNERCITNSSPQISRISSLLSLPSSQATYHTMFLSEEPGSEFGIICSIDRLKKKRNNPKKTTKKTVRN